MLSKLSFVVGVCLMTIVAQAQITLDQNDFPYGGLSLPRYFAWTWQDSIGNPGAGQAYDFSHLVIAIYLLYVEDVFSPKVNIFCILNYLGSFFF